MTGHPPRQVSVASAVPIAVADTASVRRAIDQVWQLPVTQAVVRCGDQRPTRAAASRSWRDSVGPLMPCGRRRPGQRRRGVGEGSWSAPCRRAGGRQCAGSGQGRRRGRPGRGIDAAPHPVCAGELEREMRSASSGVQTRPPWLHPRRVRTGGSEMARILPVGDPFASGRWCDGRSRMSRRLVPPWRGRHCRGHAVHRAHGISRFPWPPPCSRSGRTGYACGPPTTPPTAIGRPPATAEGSESRAKDERGGLRRYRSRYRAVRSATASPPGAGTRLRARSGSQVLAAVGRKGRVGGWFAS